MFCFLANKLQFLDQYIATKLLTFLILNVNYEKQKFS